MEADVIHQTDALSGLKLLEDGSVDCIATSPPYWQLRDYGLDAILWGGDTVCIHDFDEWSACRICGGWSGQLGQEPSREMYIAHLLMIFDECRRVLKKTGTLWVNLGDSYSKPHKYNRAGNDRWGNGKNTFCLNDIRVDMSVHRIPPKSLCNIPGRFADEMVLRGWILRNEIIWHKPAVIPASVRDRFTIDFEKVFFFTKFPKYGFRQQFEPYAASTSGRYERGYNTEGFKNAVYRKQYGAPAGIKDINPMGRNMRTVWRIATESNHEMHFAAYPAKLVETPIMAGCPEGGVVLDPFMGSGTTAVAAKRLGRHYIGFEPNPAYVDICNRRLGHNFNNNIKQI
ncbi:methyltransferase [Bacteroidia bacterium]|nr:methyltransferase [Bacteroidia bacterium]